MPLSDEENRILREIEQQLIDSDPDLALNVREVAPGTSGGGRLRFWAFGLFAALVATVYLLKVHYIAAFGGFLVCFALGLLIDAALRQRHLPDNPDDGATSFFGRRPAFFDFEDESDAPSIDHD